MRFINQKLKYAIGVVFFLVFGFLFQNSLAFELQTQQIYLNDPGYTSNINDIDKQWALVKTGFLEAWEKTTGSKFVVVAILDTGIDATHNDLQSINFIQGYDLINQKNILPNANSDDNGHGTLVAGVLAATPNNHIGIAGAVWNISIMPVKVLDANGVGDTSKVAKGIFWAVDNGANIINLSLGGIAVGHDVELSDAIAYAFKKNVLIISASGNDSSAHPLNLDNSPVFPVCTDNGQNMTLGVGALDQYDQKTEFSNFGRNCIDVMAPGKRILSTISFDPITKIKSPNSYAYTSGTSLATALVSGQATLIKSLFPNATNVQIRDRIIASADQIDNLNISQCDNKSCKGFLGAGRINVKKSLEFNISGQKLFDGDVVRVQEKGLVYLILGGKKQLVSSFVFNQRFLNYFIKNVFEYELLNIPEANYALPLDGTLVKSEKEKTVYYIKNGLKMPILSVVFKNRNLKFSEIKTVSDVELSSWQTGSFLPPKEGVIVKNPSGRSQFWVVSETLRPINRQFILEKGISKFPKLVLSDKDIQGFSKGEKLY